MFVWEFTEWSTLRRWNIKSKSIYLPLRGVDLSYTPYTIVHHQLDHKFGDWIEEMRYPVDQKRVEEYKKKHMDLNRFSFYISSP